MTIAEHQDLEGQILADGEPPLDSDNENNDDDDNGDELRQLGTEVKMLCQPGTQPLSHEQLMKKQKISAQHWLWRCESTKKFEPHDCH